jgi:hypothetical protein
LCGINNSDRLYCGKTTGEFSVETTTVTDFTVEKQQGNLVWKQQQRQILLWKNNWGIQCGNNNKDRFY